MPACTGEIRRMHDHQCSDLELDDWTAIISGHVEAVNAATEAIPTESIRLHICWGAYQGLSHP
jgi:methionine synthase II (cobalamin-independent)